MLQTMKKKIIIIVGITIATLAVFSCSQNDAKVAPESSGKGGSMARFAIAKNYLYVVDHSSLKYFNIEQPLSPEYIGSLHIEQGIETIFSYGDNLFLGARAGMHIFDISNPSQPVKLSTYRHIVSCDPVVVDGNIAYVTLRAGTTCGGGENLLDVIDIENLNNPVRIQSFNMISPYGLGLADTLLFVCEGEWGIRVFNVKDKYMPQQIGQIEDIFGYDVIPLTQNKNLIITGKTGIFQYDFTDPMDLKLLSKLSIEQIEP